jgi:LIM domain
VQVCAACHRPLSKPPSSSGGLSGFLSSFSGRTEYVIFPHDPHKAYHPQCLKCAACRQALSVNERAAIKDDQVYHYTCLQKKTRPVCACCNHMIPSEVRSQPHMRLPWHAAMPAIN